MIPVCVLIPVSFFLAQRPSTVFFRSLSRCHLFWRNAGATTTIGSGAFALTGGGFQFNNASQYGRLGSNALTVTMDPAIRDDLFLAFCDSISASFANPMSISGGFGSNLNINYGNGSTDAGTTLTLPNTLSGDMRGGWNNDRGFINVATRNVPYNNDDRNRLIIQGNNNALISQHPTDWGYGIMHIPQGAVLLENANALGAGNSLSIFLGNNANSTTNNFAGLLTTSGNNVSSHVYVREVANGGNQHRTVSAIGLSGTGSVTFSGDFQMPSTSWTMSQGPNGEGPNLARLQLTAPAGGQANFTGHFVDGYSGDPYFTTVTVLAGGKVKIAGDNAYRGQTTVRGGTLLVGGYDNALGQNTPAGAFTPTNISLGGDVVAPAGGNVVAATTNGNLPVSGYSAGVMTFGSGVTSLDGVLLSAGDRVLVKDAAWNPERTGVYTVTDSTHWTRATDLNTASAFPEGLRIHVAVGTANGGKNFYLPSGLWNNAVIGDYNTGSFLFNPDASSNTNVAILTDDARTISRNIDVTNNLSTGQSIIGGNSAVTSTFSGTVALSKDLAVQAVTSGTVIFSGDITGSNNVVVQGSGTVLFNKSKSYTGTTTISSGTLEVDNSTVMVGSTPTIVPTIIASSGVTVNSGGILQGTGTVSNTLSVTGTGIVSPGKNGVGILHAGATTISGHLAVNVEDTAVNKLVSTGAVNLSGGTVDVTVGGAGFNLTSYVVAQGSSITGTLPSVTTGYQVAVVTSGSVQQLVLSQAPANSFTAWVAGYPTLSDTTPGGNPSHDGLSNLVKYALGLDPTKSAQPAGTVSSGSLTFDKGTMAQGDSNIAYSIEESPDLVIWTTQSGPSVSNGATAITYTFPTGQSKVFARLKVIQTP